MAGSLSRPAPSADAPAIGEDNRPPNPEDRPGAVPGFHRRKEVRSLLFRMRTGISVWHRVRTQRVDEAWDGAQRFVLPQHTMYIK